MTKIWSLLRFLGFLLASRVVIFAMHRLTTLKVTREPGLPQAFLYEFLPRGGLWVDSAFLWVTFPPFIDTIMSFRTRFAPSPTGFLHIGGARTALYNWLFARKNGGSFLVRVEDTDADRSTSESMQVILDGLRWLGLDWDEGPEVGGEFGPYRQSERSGIYDSYLEKLEAAGLTYEEDGAVRFRVPEKDVVVHDLVCGDVRTNLKDQGSKRWDSEAKKEIASNPDFIIRRPDGSYIFHFVNVVDDIEMKISHVVRGEDHLSNTAKHLALFQAFGAPPPVFAHIPLNLNQDGSKMSKRDQGALIHEYIDLGFLPDAVNNYMALLGWSPGDDREIFSLDELVESFDLSGINHSNSKFDFEKCQWVNGEHIRKASVSGLIDAAKPFFEKSGIGEDDERIERGIELARERARLLSDFSTVLAPVFQEKIDLDPDAIAKVKGKDGIGELLTELAAELEKMEETDWQADHIKEAIKNAAKNKGQKLGALMLPCRVATTGSTSGADLLPMMELMGKSIVVDRIHSLVSRCQ